MVLNAFATNNLRNLYKKILGNEGQFLTTFSIRSVWITAESRLWWLLADSPVLVPVPEGGGSQGAHAQPEEAYERTPHCR